MVNQVIDKVAKNKSKKIGISGILINKIYQSLSLLQLQGKNYLLLIDSKYLSGK